MMHKISIRNSMLGVDDQSRAVGLITVTDMEKAVAHRGRKGRAGSTERAAATTVGEGGFERTELADRCRRRFDLVDTATRNGRVLWTR